MTLRDRITYQIDALDVIDGVSDSWAPFAEANGAASLNAGVLGRPLWDFVADLTTQQVYRDLIGRAKGGRDVSFSYRCDAPELRRFMRMTMTPTVTGGIAFDSVTLRTEARAAPALIEAPGAVALDGPLLLSCSWCKRIDVGHGWEEVEDAVEHLGLFAGGPMPMVTHAICPDCIARLLPDEGLG